MLNFYYSSPKDPFEIVENKFTVLNHEQYLLENLSLSKEVSTENTEEQDTKNTAETKFILPLDDTCENHNHIEKKESSAGQVTMQIALRDAVANF